MRFDSYSQIGKGKGTSQDYVMTGENFGVLCDGCSAEPRSDFGARLLAQNAAILLKHDYEALEKLGDIGMQAYRKAAQHAALLELEEKTLSATLLFMAHSSTDWVRIAMYGDGYFFWKHVADEEIMIDKISFQTNDKLKRSLPFYLRYACNPAQRESYLAKGVVKYHNEASIANEMLWFRDLDTQAFEFAGIASDGFSSFWHDEERRVLRAEECLALLKECLSFQSYVGKFVKREMAYHAEVWQKRGISVQDDLSLIVGVP